jgi:hypothetical protein
MFVSQEVEVKSEAGPVSGADPAELSDDELDHQTHVLWAHVHAAMGRAVVLQAEINRRELWNRWGAKSPGQWLSWRAGLSLREATSLCRVADRSDDCPQTAEALRSGELSLAKAAAITRVATEATEATMVDYARHAPTPELEAITRAYRKVTETPSTEQERHDRRYLTTYFDDNCDYIITGRLTPDAGAVVEAALAAAGDRIGFDPDVGGSGHNAEALAFVAESALRSLDPGAGSDRYQVVVHVSDELLASGLCEVSPGAQISPETARRIACDAAIVEMVQPRAGDPVAGRKARAVPTRMRRALEARDRTCRWPGCTSRGHIDAHHIVFWRDGGPTHLSNLVLLCRFHHRRVHEGGYRLVKDGKRFRFFAPAGWEIPPAPEPHPPGNDLETALSDLGVDVDPAATLPAQFVGETDIDLAVHCLLQDDRAAGRLEGAPP